MSVQVQEVAAPGAPCGGADATPYRVGVLDSVRGVAALVVVIHHCLLTQPAFSNFFFSNWETAAGSTTEQVMFHTPARIVWAGAEAVTLFYVLSGLVLALPWVEGRPPRYGGYCIKRICRIYLPYCAAVAGAMVLNVLLRPHADILGLSRWVNEMTWTNPVTPYVAVDHLLMIGHRNTVDGVIHTLIWEMRVSLLFPLLVMPVVRWRGWGAAGVALVLAVAIGSLQFILRREHAAAGPSAMASRPGCARKIGPRSAMDRLLQLLLRPWLRHSTLSRRVAPAFAADARRRVAGRSAC